MMFLAFKNIPCLLQSSRNKKVKHAIMDDIASPSTAVHGLLQCIWREEFPIYTLLLDECEDLLIARPRKSKNCPAKDNSSWIYTFHKGSAIKGNGRWITWGRKDKLALSLAGYMKASSVLCPEVTSSGDLKCFIESEFVLLDSKPIVSFRFLPSDISHYHTLTNSMSILGKTKRIFPSISAIALPPTIPRQCPHPGLWGKSVSKGNQRHLVNRNTFVKARFGRRVRLSDKVYDKDVRLLGCQSSCTQVAAVVTRVPAEEQEMIPSRHYVAIEAQGWGLKFLQSSLRSSIKLGAGCKVGLAPVVESETASGSKLSASDEDCRLKESEEKVKDEVNGQVPAQYGMSGTVESSVDDKLDHMKWSTGPKTASLHVCGQLVSSEGSIQKNACTGVQNIVKERYDELTYIVGVEKLNKEDEHQIQEHANVTVILPVGQHGLPTVESSGPSPLIERWRSGGNCDCGGWDLGCGLNILSTDSPSLHDKEEVVDSTGSLTPENPLKIFSQGRRQAAVVLSLSAVQDDFFSLSFQSQVSPLQAFATAVAILHSRKLLLCRAKQEKA
eukprot:c27757_g1_i2 orf=967-2634(+)